MIYTAEQYKTLALRFNSQSFLQKILIIKNNQNLFCIETDGYNLRLRLEHQAQLLGLDLLFEFPETLSFENFRDLFSFIDVKVSLLP
jgi:hypothetical protein